MKTALNRSTPVRLNNLTVDECRAVNDQALVPVCPIYGQQYTADLLFGRGQ